MVHHGKLSGFCLLLTPAVYDKVRGLDELFQIHFADDDVAERGRRAGFQLAVAHDLFVHHFGGRTVAASVSAQEQTNEPEAELVCRSNWASR
jgi:GT2 family glycosyltransferase